MKAVILDTSRVRGMTASSGYSASLPVFREKGWYTILLAQNLETENTHRTLNRCRVYFSGVP